jgi:TetR/AcrR family fatty acid metabolism transcriptional regulator
MHDSALPRAETDKSRAILHVAERLFSERGYHGVSVDEIARDAGVSKGLVLYHFKSKQDLFQNVLIDGFLTIENEMRAIVQSEMTGREKIRATVAAYLEFDQRRLNLLGSAHDLGPVLAGTEAHARAHELVNEERARLAKLVEDAVAKGEFRPVDSRVAANVVLGAIHGLAMETVLEGRSLSVDKVADDVTSIICDGVGR